MITPHTRRRIGGTLKVADVARRLRHYAYAEMRLMEAQASWLPFVPFPELKIEWGYQLYEDAYRIDAMRCRMPEVGAHDQKLVPPNERFVSFCNELTNTEDLIERLAGLYWVLRPQLAATYRDHIRQGDSVTDNPTIRRLQKSIIDHESYSTWGDDLLRSMLRTPEEWKRAESWRDHLLAMLSYAGGITGEAAPGQAVSPYDDSPGKRFRKDPPQRDDRFIVRPYERHEGRSATDVWDQETLLKYMFMMVEGELEATESCSRTLYDFPDVPWELRFQLAAQLWDEARHAELSYQRFLEMGGRFDMLPVRDTFPLYFGPVHNDDICRRLAHLNQVTEGWVTDDFAMMVDICRGMGDERSARLFEYLQTDEWSHIRIGAEWIPRLTADDPAYRDAVVEYRTQAERELFNILDAAAKEVAEKRHVTNGDLTT